MRKLTLTLVAAVGTTLAACGEAPTTTETVSADVDAAAPAAGTVQYAAVGAVDSPCGWYGPLDGDGDGAVNQVEYGNFGRVNFERWDLDDNARLSRDEFQRCAKDGVYDRVAGTFGAFDANDDGSVSEGEFFASDRFGAWDTNRNGRLENSEWSSAA